jgi:hypothetical protein
VLREVPLLNVGLIMMALTLTLLIAAVVVSVALRSDPKRVVAAEVATKSPDEAPLYSSGEEESATKKSSSQKESLHYPSEEESLGYGSSSSSGESVGHQEEQAREPQAVLQQEAQTPKSQSQCFNRRAGKLILRCSLSRSPNHNSTKPTNKSNLCQRLNKEAGPRRAKERQRRTSLRTASRSHNGSNYRSDRHL